jgi:pimeloyl-ACP methyl ester carboxylesterase
MQLISYDRRGFGRSDAPADLRLEVDDIRRILQRLELPTVHLLGMSQGGRIALRFAVTHERMLRSLILQGAVIDGLDVEEQWSDNVPISEYAALAKAGRVEEVKQRWQQHPMMRLAPGCESGSQLVADILGDYSGADLVNFAAERYGYPVDVLEALPSLAIPTMVITGKHETESRKRHGDEIQSRVNDCETVLLNDSGHLSNISEPGQYNDAVRRFCEKVETARAAS